MHAFFRHILLLPLTLAVFWVLTHWGFWTEGVYALGWNASLFWLALGHAAVVANPRISYKNDWPWMAPIMLISLSFALYENPWLKGISFALLPLLSALFYAFGNLPDKWKKRWNTQQILDFIDRMIQPFMYIADAFRQQIGAVPIRRTGALHANLKHILLGLAVFVGLAVVFIIPLLSEADPAFARAINNFYQWVEDLINWSTIAKLFAGLGIMVGIGAAFLGYNRPLDAPKNDHDQPGFQINSITATIILGGVLALYILFISLQLERLFVGDLPFDFVKTEQLVKSGFWQLFFLSFINTGLFFLFYKRTGTVAQWVLRAFIISSALLLLSGAWRMVMYVKFYGLSYEKFFALYTVVFAVGLLGYMVWASFSRQKEDILRAIAFGFLWGYGLVTILPVEHIIMTTNMGLRLHPDSRIEMTEMSMLSAEVYGIANANRQALLALEKESTKDRTEGYYDNTKYEWKERTPEYWQPWFEEIEAQMADRAWYETNLSLELNKR